MEFAGSIAVEDASGCRFKIHQYRVRQFFRTVKCFVLETGEVVERAGADNYVVARTGETLVPIGA